GGHQTGHRTPRHAARRLNQHLQVEPIGKTPQNLAHRIPRKGEHGFRFGYRSCGHRSYLKERSYCLRTGRLRHVTHITLGYSRRLTRRLRIRVLQLGRIHFRYLHLVEIAPSQSVECSAEAVVSSALEAALLEELWLECDAADYGLSRDAFNRILLRAARTQNFGFAAETVPNLKQQAAFF